MCESFSDVRGIGITRQRVCAVVVAALLGGAVSGVATGGTGAVTLFPVPAGCAPGGIAPGLDGNLWTVLFREYSTCPTPGDVLAISAAGALVHDVTPTTPCGQLYTIGPDGNFWFGGGMSWLCRMTPGGVTTRFPIPTPDRTQAAVAGPDGDVWFSEHNSHNIKRVAPDGSITMVTELPNDVEDMTFGQDGNLWVIEDHPLDAVARVAPDGTVTEFPMRSGAGGITAGVDGNIWLTEPSRHALVRVTPGGTTTEFRLRLDGSPESIQTGSDGNLWFLEGTPSGQLLVRRTTDGTITEFPLPPGITGYFPLVPGPDGNLWGSFHTADSTATYYLGRISIAQPGTKHVLVLDAGLVGASPSLAVGATVQWDFYAAAPYRVADITGLSTFDSGSKTISTFYPWTFTEAGVYAYQDPSDPSFNGKVTVAPTVSPSTGTTSTTFTLTWATAPLRPSRVFDIQIRRPGTNTYTAWLSGTPSADGTFKPDAGPGTYSFHVRSSDTVTGAKSGYAGRAIVVR